MKTAQTYNQVSTPKTNNFKNNVNISLKRDTAAALLTYMLRAHFQNIAKPESYNKEIKKLFTMKNLLKENLPDNQPSLEVINTNSTHKHSKSARATRKKE